MPLGIAAMFYRYLPELMWIWIAFLLFEVLHIAALVASASRSITYCKQVMAKVFDGDDAGDGLAGRV